MIAVGNHRFSSCLLSFAEVVIERNESVILLNKVPEHAVVPQTCRSIQGTAGHSWSNGELIIHLWQYQTTDPCSLFPWMTFTCMAGPNMSTGCRPPKPVSLLPITELQEPS